MRLATRARALVAVLVATLVMTLAMPMSADEIDAEIAAGSDFEGFSAWFIELSGAPTIEGGSITATKAEKQAFRDAARAAALSFSERFAYDDLFNGLSVSASRETIAALARLAGVKAVWPVVTESLPIGSTDSEVIDLATAMKMTGADQAQATGLSGKNVRVAVMDTGIDYHHPDLGGCFGTDDVTGVTCRVYKGHDFVGDAFNADSTSPSFDPHPVADPDPDDCNGHGTHVAGIVGANGRIKGVAPDVRFGAYRVFGCNGSTFADIMLAAMERALHDNMDVLNMSIGSSFQWPQYPTAVGADRLVTKKGMVVVASIGNSGPGASAPNGLYAAGAPGVGANVIGVASIDNTHLFLRYFTVSPADKQVGFIQASASPLAPSSGSFPMARTGTASSTADACGPLAAGSLSGKVALIRRGTCSFHQKSLNAQNAGAVGVVLYNNTAGYVNATVAGSPAITIPVVGTDDVSGAQLSSLIAAGTVTLTWTAESASFTNSVSGGRVSGFSSYGVAADLSLKPDIAAPGGNIRSTLPLERGAYGLLSGTSMAAPHVAGAAALYLEANRSRKPGDIRAILQNGARPVLTNTSVGPNAPAPAGVLDSVHRQGAGIVDIGSSLAATASVSPGKLSLGESEGGPVTRALTITNRATSDLTFVPSFETGIATGPNTFLPLSFPTPAQSVPSVAFGAPSVSVKKGDSATLNVTIAPNVALPARSLYGGWVVLSASDGTTYRVPFSGFTGDYQSIAVVNNASRRHICRQLPSGSFALGGVQTFTYANANETPNFCVHFDHQSRIVSFTIQDASTNATLGEAFSVEHLARNSSTGGFFAFPWNGTVTSGGVTTTLPNGSYKATVNVLKALGDPSVAGHTETVQLTGTIVIERP